MKFFALVAVLLLSCQVVLSYPAAYPDEAIEGRHRVLGLGGLGGGFYQGGYIGGYGGHGGSFGGYNNGIGGYSNGFTGQGVVVPGVVVPGIVGIQHGGLYNGGHLNGGIVGGNIW